MSTFFHPTLRCPACSASFQPAIIKGLHITRLPEARAAILNGSFQRFTCGSCGHVIRVERTDTVYTDFDRGHYVAVESRHQRDWKRAKAKHAALWDGAFTLGPDVAESLSRGMRHRLVFGTLALREKLLAWDNDLDDLCLEAAKGDALAARGLPLQELRLSAVVPDGPMIFMRLGAAAPLGPGPDGVTVLPELVINGHVLVSRDTYRERLRQRSQVFNAYPWLADDWVVDLWVSSPAAERALNRASSAPSESP